MIKKLFNINLSKFLICKKADGTLPYAGQKTTRSQCCALIDGFILRTFP